MTKRKIILIGIVVGGLAILALVFMYFYKPATQGGGASTGTNFLSNFFPFGKTNTNTGTSTNTPANISGYVAPTNGATTQEKLTKVSSMPIAGYGVFMKERYKDVLLPPLSAQ